MNGDCCLVDHMRAKPPWTCPCKCHSPEAIKELEKRMSDPLPIRVTFDSEPEAFAFVRGVEFIDNDHVAVDGPENELDSEGQDCYVVTVRQFA